MTTRLRGRLTVPHRVPQGRCPACGAKQRVTPSSSISACLLPETFYDRSVHEVAHDLIGCTIVHGETAGMIVETESYHADDEACHAFGGLTVRNRVLFGPPAHAYVYLSYGIHSLLNFVAEPEGEAAAVLIRALEPVDGEALMRRRRARGSGAGAPLATDDLCRGPGNLTRAMGISLADNRRDFTAGRLRIEDRGLPSRVVAWSRRIGISVGVEAEWRVFAADSTAVTRTKPSASSA
jgi:DNA-3-methyladenine glycosylase